MRDQNAVEMLRAWIAERGLHCSIKVGMYAESTQIDEGMAWGILLADVTRHVASALQQGYELDEAEMVQKIRQSYVAELRTPTSKVEGQFLKKTKA